MGRALDLILTGRAVAADEALAMGLANPVVDDGSALAAAQALALQIAGFPQRCMRAIAHRPSHNGACRWPRRCSRKAHEATTSRWPKGWPARRVLPPVPDGTAPAPD